MNLILIPLVLFLIVCEGQDNIDTFVIQSTKAVIVPRREKGKSQGLFRYPQHHPLSNRDKDYSFIHPHDTLNLFLKMENGTSYFIVLKPNLDLISPDIHKEVANNKLSSNHPHTILSTMKVYQGHMGQEVLESHGSFFLDSASVVIQDDGKYVPTQTSTSAGISSTQHQFLNPKIKGSININGEVFEISSPLENRGTLLKKRASSTSSSGSECGIIPQRQGQFFRKSSLMKRAVSPCPKTVKVANIAVAADCNYVLAHKEIKGTADHLISLFNDVSKVYEEHFNVKIRIAKTYLEAKCDGQGNPWNVPKCDGYNVQSMLPQFTSWIQNKNNPGIAYSTLLSGCQNSDTTVGYAFKNELCSPRAVGVMSNVTTELNVAVHEMGHVFGSNHDCDGKEQNCCQSQGPVGTKSFVMNPTSSPSTTFSRCTIDLICNTISNKGKCLTDSNGKDENDMTNQDSGGTIDPQGSENNSAGKGVGSNGGCTCNGNQPATLGQNKVDGSNQGSSGNPGGPITQQPTSSAPATSSPGSYPKAVNDAKGSSFSPEKQESSQNKADTTGTAGTDGRKELTTSDPNSANKNRLSNSATHGKDDGTSSGYGVGPTGGGGSISTGNQRSTSSVPNNAPTSPSPGSCPNAGNNFENTSPPVPSGCNCAGNQPATSFPNKAVPPTTSSSGSCPFAGNNFESGHSPSNPVSPGSSEKGAKTGATASDSSSNPLTHGNDASSVPPSKFGGSGTAGTSSAHSVGTNIGGGSTSAGNQHSTSSVPNNAPTSPSPGSCPNARNSFEKTSPTAPSSPVCPGKNGVTVTESSSNPASHKNDVPSSPPSSTGGSGTSANSGGQGVGPNEGGGTTSAGNQHSSSSAPNTASHGSPQEVENTSSIMRGSETKSLSSQSSLNAGRKKNSYNPKDNPPIRNTGISLVGHIGSNNLQNLRATPAHLSNTPPMDSKSVPQKNTHIASPTKPLTHNVNVVSSVPYSATNSGGNTYLQQSGNTKSAAARNCHTSVVPEALSPSKTGNTKSNIAGLQKTAHSRSETLSTPKGNTKKNEEKKPNFNGRDNKVPIASLPKSVTSNSRKI